MEPNRVPAGLRSRLGEEATVGLLELLDSTETRWSERVLNTSAERFERRLTEEISALRVDIAQSLATLRVELLKWSFVFWIGQVAAIASLLAFMLRATGR